jgi:F-type H+-transporting ATPase subunit epsilon
VAGDHKLEAEVLTPEGSIFEGELQMVSTRTTTGQVGILAKHIPMVARLLPAELRLHKSDSDVETYAQGEGWLEVFANRVRVLVAEATPPDQLDVSDLKRRLDEAEQSLKEAEEGSAAAEQAERERARCEAFIQIAESGTP